MASPWGRTTAWEKRTYRCQRRTDIKGLGMEVNCDKEEVGRVSGRKSVKDGHVVVPLFWEVRPELVYGMGGRSRVS